MSTKRGNKLAAQETATGRGVTPQRHAPARHGDNSMRVYDVLRQRIATRQYAPGSRLTEAEIALEFEVSRTPVRQALHRIATAERNDTFGQQRLFADVRPDQRFRKAGMPRHHLSEILDGSFQSVAAVLAARSNSARSNIILLQQRMSPGSATLTICRVPPGR